MGDYAGRRNSRKRATRRAKATRIKACSHLVADPNTRDVLAVVPVVRG